MTADAAFAEAAAGAAEVQSATTKTVTGYWMLSADGRVFPCGSAAKLGESVGSAPGRVDLGATPSSGGYWVLTEAGGIFAFGDAKFHGAPAPLPAGVTSAWPARRTAAATGCSAPGAGSCRSATRSRSAT